MSEQKILELIEILKSIEQEVSLHDICDRLGTNKDKASILQLTATIRFVGYEVYGSVAAITGKGKKTR